jgi:hypothetical protein
MSPDPIADAAGASFLRATADRIHPTTREIQPADSVPVNGGSPSDISNNPSAVPSRHHRAQLYWGIGAAVVVAIIVTAYILTGGFHRSSSASTSDELVLIHDGTSYSMNIGEFNGIYFSASSASSIDGQLNSSRGIQVYLMTPDQFQTLTRTLNVSGYTWTSGVVAIQTVYDLHIPVPVGEWVLSFVNPNPDSPTGVGIYSNVVLSPA